MKMLTGPLSKLPVLLGLFSIMTPVATARASFPRCRAVVTPFDSPADVVRRIANVLYEPFAQYDFGANGICIDPAMFQVFTNVYLRRTDGYSPTIASLCLNRPQAGALSIRWSLGPTPEGALLVEAGEDEDYVDSHDFWRVGAPDNLICSEKLNLKELIFEREGGFDVHLDSETPQSGSGAWVRIHGVSMNVGLPDSGLPAFLTDDIGLDALIVSDQGIFTADLSAPLFNIPVSATGGAAPGDPFTLDILGIRFLIHRAAAAAFSF